MKTKAIYKFATGDVIPEGAVYLNTVVQTRARGVRGRNQPEAAGPWSPCWLVWHYFLVEVDA
jgi:hypothetical protein